MLILGLNCHHGDASAALVCDGALVAAVAEERLNRRKHCAGFPAAAIVEVLRIAGASIEDVDHIAIARDSMANLGAKLRFILKSLRSPAMIARSILPRLKGQQRISRIPGEVAALFGRTEAQVRARYHHVEHHLAHAASAFFVSPFERAAILTADGSGDFATTLLAGGEGRHLEVVRRILLPHSLGVFYTTLCQFIGYDQYGDEGKVMGLAPYGEPIFAEAFERILRITEDGFVLDLDFFTHHEDVGDWGHDEAGNVVIPRLHSQKFIDLLGEPRVRHAELTKRDMDIAASLQLVFERVYLRLLRKLAAETGHSDLCLAGGCALNSVANGRIFRETPFRRLYAQPAASDDGTALGAAFYVAHEVLDLERCTVMNHAFFGSRFTDKEVASALRAAGLPCQPYERAELLRQTAAAVADGLVVGWFQGAMEWGPRALGNRSIVAHPGRPDMKDILNARIKHREAFRPFAPSILVERVGEYFTETQPSPFMMLVYKTRPEVRARICAVNHIDDTGRLQTVERSVNPLYYDLIAEFEKLTGIPVVLNTSFNENEPIVCRPSEAIECFQRTRMDVLAIGSFLCRKPDAVPLPGLACGREEACR